MAVSARTVSPMTRSQELFAKALERIPGGVNSPVRAFRAVGGDPVFMERGEGSKIIDVDGRAYVDYVMSWGPLILGHCHPEIVEAVTRAARTGTSFGACTEAEVKLAEQIHAAFPSVERVRKSAGPNRSAMRPQWFVRPPSMRDRNQRNDEPGAVV